MTSKHAKRQRRARRQEHQQAQAQRQANIQAAVDEMIGRSVAPGSMAAAAAFRGLYNTSADYTTPDYPFWDGLRHGTLPDYHLGGLFAEPIVTRLMSWIFGEEFGATIDGAAEEGGTDDAATADTMLMPPLQPEMTIATAPALSKPVIDATNAEITTFIEKHGATIKKAAHESYNLGDQYIIVNADGSLTLPSPNDVEILTEPPGSLNVVGYKLTTNLDKMTITDVYTQYGRVRSVKSVGSNGGTSEEIETYSNLIGMIPVIHFACQRGTNELHGHPYYSRLRRLFERYDKALNKSLDGVELMGNPKPAVQGVKNPKETLEAMATGTTQQRDPNTGQYKTKPMINFADLPIIATGENGKFEFVSPASGFTADTEKMLGILFLLMLQFSGVPEWVWGGAIASSNASVDAQLPAFAALIRDLRLELEPPILQTIRVWLAYRRLSRPRIAVVNPRMIWTPVVSDDKQLRLDTINDAKDRNLLTDETTLDLYDLVDDPAGEVKRAKKEADEKARALIDSNPDNQVDAGIDAVLNDNGSGSADGSDANAEAA